MSMHFVCRSTRFSKDRRGVAAVEFGLLAMPFLALLCAIFEIGFVDFENELLSAAVTKAARAMLTGQTQGASITTAAQFVSTYLCPASGPRLLPPNFNCANLIVDVRTATSFVSGDMANDFYKSSANEFCPGAPGQIVVMRVAYPLRAIFPLDLFNPTTGVVSDVPGQSGFFHVLLGEALFQEENYTNSFTAPVGC